METLKQAHPFFFTTGIMDFDASIHSIFLSYLVILGNKLRYISIADYPIFDNVNAKILNQERALRPDSVWFDYSNMNVAAIFEFERSNPYQPEKLRKKLLNLAICKKHIGNDDTITILMYWQLVGEDVDLKSLKSIIGREINDNGFLIEIPKNIIIFKVLFKKHNNKLILVEMVKMTK
ncbi:MAG: hypothetical protein Q7R95_03910 [bacterium]|nr:hypothetical protein [bacterium]